MTTFKAPLLILVSLMAFSSWASAEVFEPRRIDPDLWRSPHFQRAHPDLKHRVIAQEMLEEGRVRAAIKAFEDAAHWGDKLSQAMIAEIYWTGEGVSRDRPRAYAWMDLAAERNFVAFIAKREKYWSQLDAQEREQALAIGADLYARFGDDQALPRLDSKLFRERKPTGSRTGFGGSGYVVLPGTGGSFLTLVHLGLRSHVMGGVNVPLHAYYAPQLWGLDKYVDWHADQLELARRGVVRVGAAEDAG